MLTKLTPLSTAFSFLFVFVLLLLLRLYFCNPTLGLDEAEQIVLGQSLDFGYPAQPPFYTWLQYLVFYCFGTNLFSLAFLKYGLLVVALIVYYQLCRLVCKPPFILPAVCSWALIPNISYDLLSHRTHVILALLASCLTMYWMLYTASEQVDKTVFHPFKKTLSYLSFGLILGIGCLSKFNYLLFLFIFILAALSVPLYRKKLSEPYILLSLAVMLLMVMPYVVWILKNPDLAFHSAYKLIPKNQNLTDGLLAFGLSSICFILPCLFISAFFYSNKTSIKTERLLQVLLTLKTLLKQMRLKKILLKCFGQSTVSEPPPTHGLLLRYHSLLGPVLVIMILIAGLHEVKTHWLLPLFCFIPLLFFNHLSQQVKGEKTVLSKERGSQVSRVRPYLSICLLFQGLLLTLWVTRTPYLAKWPLDDFVKAIKAQDTPIKAVASNSHWLLGSLIYRLDVSKAYLLYPRIPFELPANGTLLVAWEGREITDFLATSKAATSDKRIEVNNTVNMLGGSII